MKKPVADAAGPLLSRSEAAAYLGIKSDTLKKWSTQRRIRHVRIGARNKYLRTDLDAFIAANVVEPAR